MTLNYESVRYWGLRIGVVLGILVALLVATEFAAEATHRATEPCVNCSWWNWLCRFGNYLANCHGGH